MKKTPGLFTFLLFSVLVFAQEQAPQAPPPSKQAAKANPMASIMGAKWGESMTSFKNDFKYKDHLSTYSKGFYIPWAQLGNLDIGQISFLFLLPGADQYRHISKKDMDKAYLSAVVFHTTPDKYKPLLRIFTEKYGKPAEIKNREIQDRFGIRYDQQTAEWRDLETQRKITLKRYGPKLYEAFVQFTPMGIQDVNDKREKIEMTVDTL